MSKINVSRIPANTEVVRVPSVKDFVIVSPAGNVVYADSNLLDALEPILQNPAVHLKHVISVAAAVAQIQELNPDPKFSEIQSSIFNVIAFLNEVREFDLRASRLLSEE